MNCCQATFVFDKSNKSILFCSLVSGEIIEIVRGKKRKILEIKILADKEINYLNFPVNDPEKLKREKIIGILLKYGACSFIRQRPFGIIANPAAKPKSIFISVFDSNPLAPDLDFIMKDAGADFQKGLDILKYLTDGKLHLNIKKLVPHQYFPNQKVLK